MELILVVWNWKIEPIPVLLALAFYFIPVNWRSKYSDHYTPIYFAFYPFNKLNLPLSKYLGESFYDEYLDENDAERDRKVIRFKSVYNLGVYLIVTPIILSMCWSFMLTKNQFLLVSIIVSISIIISFIKSTYYSYTFKRIMNYKLLSVYYLMCLFVFIFLLIRIHIWVLPLIDSKNYMKIMTTFGDIFIKDIFVGILLMVILIPLLISKSFNKETRKNNIQEMMEYKSYRYPDNIDNEKEINN